MIRKEEEALVVCGGATKVLSTTVKNSRERRQEITASLIKLHLDTSGTSYNLIFLCSLSRSPDPIPHPFLLRS